MKEKDRSLIGIDTTIEKEQDQTKERNTYQPQLPPMEGAIELKKSKSFSLADEQEKVKEQLPQAFGAAKKQLSFTELYERLRNTKKSSDSFAMTLVKERLDVLRELAGRAGEKDVEYRAEYFRAVMGLRDACINYRAARFPDGEMKNDRHRIVAQLIKRSEEELWQGDVSEMKKLSSFGYTSAREAAYALRGTRGMSGVIEALNGLDSLLADDIPKEKEAFLEKRQILEQKYRELSELLGKHTADPDRMTRSTKERYRVIAELKLQLATELLQLKAFSSRSGKNCWSDIYVTKRKESAEKKMCLLDRALGTAFYTKKPDVRYYTLQEINGIAAREKLEVCYSSETLFDLTTLQFMDAIAGIREHPKESLSYRYREKRTGGRRILELYDVKASAKELKGFGSGYKTPAMPRAYDTLFSEKLLKLSPEKLIRSMQNLGYAAGEKERMALTARFTSVQKQIAAEKTVLKPDRQQMFSMILRNESDSLKLIDRKLVGEGYTNETSQKIRQQAEEKRQGKAGENGTVKAAVRERDLTKNEKLAEKLNAVADEQSNSAAIRRLSKRYIGERAGSLIPPGAAPELLSILQKIRAYVSVDATAQDMQGIRYGLFLDGLQKAEWAAINESYDISDLFMSEQEKQERKAEEAPAPVTDKNNYWTTDSKYLQFEKISIFHIKKEIAEYRRKLAAGGGGLTEQELNEQLDVLAELERLFAFSAGSLDTQNIPRDARQISDENIRYMDKDTELRMTDVSWMPLFEHEPCMEDIVQGSLGDCYFLASIAAIVERNPAFIKEMMHDNGKTVTVRLYDTDKTPVYLTMKKELPAPDETATDRYAKGAFWVMYLEKAITLMQTGTRGIKAYATRPEKKVKEWFHSDRRYYDHVDGGWAGQILPVLTGTDTADHAVVGDLGLGEKIYDKTDEEIRRDHGKEVEKLVTHIDTQVREGRILTAYTRFFTPEGNQKGLNAEHMAHGVASGHQYTILGVDLVEGKKMIKLRNPWGSGRIAYDVQKDTDVLVSRWGDQQKPGAFYMTPERFAAFFDTITSAEMKAMKPEDLIEVPARYEKAKDERIRGKLNYSPENTNRIPSSFDKKKWNDILREHTRTYKSGEEKSKYEVFDRIRKGSWEEAEKAGLRVGNLQLCSSLGDFYLNRKNENVLEFDLAGTGADLYTRGYKAGMQYAEPEVKKQLTDLRYGEKMPEYEKVRMREKQNKEKTAKKTRYNMGGASFLNGGENSMQNVEQRILEFGSRWLKPILDEMAADAGKRKEVHILISGFSRGAAAADAGLLRLGAWIHKEYPPEIGRFVRFHALLNDPTPGYGSRSGIYEEADLSSEQSRDKKGRKTKDPEKAVYRSPGKQLSSTVIYSLKSGARAILDPQKVLGADRVIISPFEHNYVETTEAAYNVRDMMFHRRPFIDPLTGCAYRGSGIDALPKGFYFADADNMLIRIDSYEEFRGLLEKLLQGYTRDGLRTEVIDAVAKRYFS